MDCSIITRCQAVDSPLADADIGMPKVCLKAPTGKIPESWLHEFYTPESVDDSLHPKSLHLCADGVYRHNTDIMVTGLRSSEKITRRTVLKWEREATGRLTPKEEAEAKARAEAEAKAKARAEAEAKARQMDAEHKREIFLSAGSGSRYTEKAEFTAPRIERRKRREPEIVHMKKK